MGDTSQEGGSPDTDKNHRVVERFYQHRSYTLLPATQTCACGRYMGKGNLRKYLPHSDSSSSSALASGATFLMAPLKHSLSSHQKVFSLLFTLISLGLVLTSLLSPVLLPKESKESDSSAGACELPPWRGQRAPYLDCGGRGCNLNHLGQEVFGKWELRQGTDGGVVVCHFNGTPSSAARDMRRVACTNAHWCSDLPHSRSATEL